MTKKIFLICLAILLSVQSAALAKKNDGLPEAERIKVAVEVLNSSRYKELKADTLLENFLTSKLVEKNLVNIVLPEGAPVEEPEGGLIRDDDVINENPAENIGELLVFDAIELPKPSTTPKNFDAERYREAGAAYVIRCEVLGHGTTQVTDETIAYVTKIIGAGLSFGGSGNSTRDKTLRRVGTGIGLGSFIEPKRTALNTVVNMQFISVDTGEILWQENFTGQAIKHHKPHKGFDNVWEEAYVKSVEDSAKNISKRVNKYIDRVIIKGKSDKSFLPKKFSFGDLSSKFF